MPKITCKVINVQALVIIKLPSPNFIFLSSLNRVPRAIIFSNRIQQVAVNGPLLFMGWAQRALYLWHSIRVSVLRVLKRNSGYLIRSFTMFKTVSCYQPGILVKFGCQVVDNAMKIRFWVLKKYKQLIRRKKLLKSQKRYNKM